MSKNKRVPDDPCTKCNAACCKSVAIEWLTPVSLTDWEHVRWLVSHKGVHVYKDIEGDWLVEFNSDCEHLDKNNRCKIYNNRMQICRDHPSDSCEKTGEVPEYKIIFKCAKDVDDYLSDRMLK